MNEAFLLLFTCVWTALVLVFDGAVGYQLWKQFDSSHYPFTTGQILSSQVTPHRSSKGGTTYGVDVEYRYVVDGQTYDSSCFRYDAIYSDHDWASQAVQAHPRGSQTKVFFNPRHPQDSVLSPDLEGGDLMSLLFLIPFNLVMFGFWSFLWHWLGEKIFKPVAGGVKIIVEGTRTSIRLPQSGPLIWCMIVMGVLSFISIFALGFASRFRPSLPAALTTLFLVLGAGAAAYLRVWTKINSGVDDFVLDETSAAIVLPETFGRNQRITINRSEIEKLTVEVVTHHGSKGGISYTYAPTLWLRDNERIQSEKLADWADKKRAEDFASWLSQRLNLPGVPVQSYT